MKKPLRYELKMTSFQKKIWYNSLKKLEQTIIHRKKIVNIYRKKLKKKNKTILQFPDNIEPIFLRYPLLVENKTDILFLAKKKNLELGDWFVSPLHPILKDLEKLNYYKGMCPIAEQICRKIINLPTHSGISEKLAERIIDFVLQ